MFDMAKLKNLKNLNEASSQAMKAFWAFDKAVFQEGAVSALNKQLMAVAVALTTSPEGRSNRRATGRNGRCCCRHSRGRCDYTRRTFVWLIRLTAAGAGVQCIARGGSLGRQSVRSLRRESCVTMPPAAVVL